MRAVKLLILGLSLLITTSCKVNSKSEIEEFDYLIFGQFYGECIGEECIETYKLTETSLYEDTLDNYVGTTFDFIILETEKFEMVKDLKNYLPQKLLDTNDSIFGCPDCSDQGGLYIMYSNNGILKSWRIDQSKEFVPEYLHDFMDRVNEKIRLINN